MAYTEAGKKAVSKYMKSNYDNVTVRVPKGKKADISAFATSKGKSINLFVNEAIDEKIEREK
jgi:predicted HicB family RNase H-like nuclease